MTIEFTYLDSESNERVYTTEHTLGLPWEYINQTFQFGYVVVPYDDRKDIVPITRLLGVRLVERMPDA